jgi:hypothetical protein
MDQTMTATKPRYRWAPSQVNCRFGAPMGRCNTSPKDIREIVETIHNGVAPRMTLQRVPMCGDYDTGGAYWGSGHYIAPLWRASDDISNNTCDTIEVFVRAWTRAEAKTFVARLVSGARFYR